jgi:cytochrome c oxidase accessory protein FixG
VLWPQDTIYLVLLMVIGALALFLFTAVAGRLWCGYACPQTVYTEIFLWFEKMIEGERPQRIKLDAAPWSVRKLAKKSAKHAVWIVFSLWTGFTFVGYFTPIRELAHDLVTLSPGAWSAFWIMFYGFATYGNAGFLREQMCRQICPYARFQFVMLDPDTLIIAYDAKRGDPRGARARGSRSRAQEKLGDCVDCSICVQVCPTGIDIRNGLQNECIGCAACIDACDQVMDKMDYPRGLIRYSTENAVSRRLTPMDIVRRAFRPRVIVYAAILLALIGRDRLVAVDTHPAQGQCAEGSRRTVARSRRRLDREHLPPADHEHRRPDANLSHPHRRHRRQGGPPARRHPDHGDRRRDRQPRRP